MFTGNLLWCKRSKTRLDSSVFLIIFTWKRAPYIFMLKTCLQKYTTNQYDLFKKFCMKLKYLFIRVMLCTDSIYLFIYFTGSGSFGLFLRLLLLYFSNSSTRMTSTHSVNWRCLFMTNLSRAR